MIGVLLVKLFKRSLPVVGIIEGNCFLQVDPVVLNTVESDIASLTGQTIPEKVNSDFSPLLISRRVVSPNLLYLQACRFRRIDHRFAVGIKSTDEARRNIDFLRTIGIRCHMAADGTSCRQAADLFRPVAPRIFPYNICSRVIRITDRFLLFTVNCRRLPDYKLDFLNIGRNFVCGQVIIVDLPPDFLEIDGNGLALIRHESVLLARAKFYCGTGICIRYICTVHRIGICVRPVEIVFCSGAFITRRSLGFFDVVKMVIARFRFTVYAIREQDLKIPVGIRRI